MKNVLGSAAEAKLGDLFIKCTGFVVLRNNLQDLGHMRPATPVQTDNSTAKGIIKHTVKQRRSKAIDVLYYWLQYQPEQGQFKIYRSKGATNRADYFTK